MGEEGIKVNMSHLLIIAFVTSNFYNISVLLCTLL